MDWNRVEGNWKQLKGAAKEKWGKLTDDDLNVIEGRREQLEGKIQQRYGFAKDQVKKDVDDWFGWSGSDGIVMRGHSRSKNDVASARL
jgi:uncharacterized protein YjbJ (UPF0337 family)